MNIRRFFIIFLILGVANSLNAQVVNVESSRLDEDSAGWQGLINFNFYNIKNTNTLFKINNHIQVQFRSGDHLLLLLNDLSFAFSQDESFENNGYQHARYNYIINNTFTSEAFVQTQTDKVLKIKFRGLAGAGARMKLLKKEKIKIYLATLYMFEYEEELDSAVIHRSHRLSASLLHKFQIGKIFSIYNINYYQPRLDKFSDFRFTSNLTLELKLSKWLSFNFSGTLSYDAYPVQDEDISKLNYKLVNGIGIRF